ncbi:hypothetical protein WDW86_04465 [Bdellovibrionota bacterium FG-2]
MARAMVRTLLALLVFGTSAPIGHALGAVATGPHGGQILSNSHYKFEVKVNGKSREVLAYLLESKKDPPQSVSVVLRKEGGAGPEIQLEPVTPILEPTPQYLGRAPQDLGSFIGVAIKIHVGREVVQIP